MADVNKRYNNFIMNLNLSVQAHFVVHFVKVCTSAFCKNFNLMIFYTAFYIFVYLKLVY